MIEAIPGRVDRDSVVLVFTDLTGSAHAFASVVDVEPFLDGRSTRSLIWAWTVSNAPPAGGVRAGMGLSN